MIFLPFFQHLLRSHSTQMTLPFGPLPQVLNVQLPLSKLLSTEWWNGAPNVVYLLTLSSVSHIFLQPRFLYQSHLKLFLSILNTPLNFNANPTFLGVPFDALFLLSIMSYPYRKSFIANFVPSDLSSLPPGAPQRNLYVLYIKPLFALSSHMLPQASFLSHPNPHHLCGEDA